MLPPSLFAQSVFHLFSMIFYWLYASFLLQIESSLYIASKVSKYFLSILLHHICILPLIVLHSFGSLFGFSIRWRFRLFFISVSSYRLIYSILWNHHLYTYKWRLNCSYFFISCRCVGMEDHNYREMFYNCKAMCEFYVLLGNLSCSS